MAEKPPYSLSISLESYRPEAINAALERLNELCSEYDQTGKVKARVAIESYQEDALLAIREQIEAYLRVKRVVIEGKVTLESPVVRPELAKTPMDDMLERLRPEPDSGIDEVILSGGGHETRLKPRTA